MNLIIDNKGIPGFTAVPNAFLDVYMPKTGGEFIKVYLYLLRIASGTGAGTEIGEMADRLNYTENDVIRALRYWEQQGLLATTEENGQIVSVSLLPAEAAAYSTEAPAAVPAARPEPEKTAVPDTALPVVPAEEAKQPAQPAAGIRAVSAAELNVLRSDHDFAEVIYVAETYLKRTLSSKDVQLFAYLFTDLGFSAELIEYLVEYCVAGNHTSIRYMETVALGWHSEGIMTLEAAKEAHSEHAAETRRVMQAFGIAGRNLTVKEKQFIKRWRKELDMPLDVIVEAVNVTMSATHQQSFEYADTVLTGWHGKGVKTVAGAKEAQTERRLVRRRQAAPEKKPQAAGSFGSFGQRTGNLDAMLKDGNW